MARKSRPWRVMQAGADPIPDFTGEIKAYAKVRELALAGDRQITVQHWGADYNQWVLWERIYPATYRREIGANDG